MATGMRARLVRVVADLMEQDPRLVVVLADISDSLFAPVAERHPLRVVNVGIMEQTAVSVAAGFALEGFLPLVHSLVPFLVERPFEQIKDDFCYQGLGGTFVSAGASYDYGTDGMTHHGAADVPILRVLPRMEVCVPGTADEFEALLRATYAGGAPTYLRMSARRNAATRPARFGDLHVERQGSRGVVVAVGPTLDPALQAAAHLDVTVLYATTVQPFDRRTLQEAIAASRPAVAVVEPYYAGGLAGEVVAAASPWPVRVECFGVPRRVLERYGPRSRHDAALGLTAEGLRPGFEALFA